MAPPEPGPALRPDIVFLDVESSGLDPDSYPVEVGVCDDGLAAQSWLVRPAPDWEGLPWTAEHVHGLSRPVLRRDGLPAKAVADALNLRLAGRLVVSDALGWDGFWLGRLYAAAGRTMAFDLRDEADAFAAALVPDRPGGAPGTAGEILARFQAADDAAFALFPRPHRAGPDARAAAARFRMTLDPGYLQACRAGDPSRAG